MSKDGTAAVRPLGVILAGGRATRMGGGDKGLRMVAGRRLIDRVIDRLAPQCAGIVLSANGDPARFGDLGLPVLADPLPDFPGPLAGVLAGLDHAAATGHDAIVTAAADTPFFPQDLVERLVTAGTGGPVLAATAEGDVLRRQPTFGLWPVGTRDALRQALLDGTRAVAAFADAEGAAAAVFPDAHAFFNVNRPEDLAEAVRIARAVDAGP